MKILPCLLAAALWAADAPHPGFREHVIATDLKGGYQVVVADLNHDGKPDLIALASGIPDLVWFEAPNWKRHVIVTARDRMINVAAADVDGDGIPELALAERFSSNAAQSEGLVSILTHDGDVARPWKIREIDRIPTAHRLRFLGPILINAPLTDAQARPPQYRSHTPLVMYRPPDWKREVISDTTQGVMHGLFLDRDDTLLTGSFEGIHEYRLRKGRWQRKLLTAGSPAAWPESGTSDIAVGHLGRDRFLTAIEPWHGNQVVVYTGRKFERHVIDTSFVDGHTVWTGDLDGDRRDEIVAGYRGPGRTVYLYRATDKKGLQWDRTRLNTTPVAAASCAIADLNGDGRPDIACIGSATANLVWYENVQSKVANRERHGSDSDPRSRAGAGGVSRLARSADARP